MLKMRLPPSVFFCQLACALEIFFASRTTCSRDVLLSPYTTISLTVAILHAWIWKLRTLNPSLGSESKNSGSSTLLSLPARSGLRISSGAIAPAILLCVRSPPALTMVRPRMHFGTRRKLFLRATKNASCSWLSAWRPCSHGKTCLGDGSGCVAKWSNAADSFFAVIEYTGGSLNSLSKPLGGWVSEVVSMRFVGEGGEAGGVSSCRDPGLGPGEQKGICLLGTGAGVPRCEVLMLNCGGGVVARVSGKGVGLCSMVAIT